MNEWISCKDKLPPDFHPVMTKILDEYGERNVQYLQRANNLWWFVDMQMYVYYFPTHWRELENREEGAK